MIQSTQDDFDWLLYKGDTPSSETGPSKAFNGDYYIYIEASKPRRLGDTARYALNSVSLLGDTARQCLN